MDLQKFSGWQKIMKPRWLNPYVYCLNNPVNLVDPTGGCSSEVPDEIPEEVLKKIIEKLVKEYGIKDLEGIYEGCERWSCEFSDDINDCYDCATLDCLYQLPTSGMQLDWCLKIKKSKCASMSAFRKEKKSRSRK